MVKALTLREKLELRAELDQELHPECASEPNTVSGDADANWLAELGRRVDGYFDGSIKSYDGKEVMAELRARIKSNN